MSGHFDHKAFQAWASKDWLGPLSAAVNAFRAFYGKTHVPAQPAAVEAAEDAIGLVVAVYEDGVSTLYDHSGLPRPATLAPPRTLKRPAKPSLAAFRSLQKKMSQQR